MTMARKRATRAQIKALLALKAEAMRQDPELNEAWWAGVLSRRGAKDEASLSREDTQGLIDALKWSLDLNDVPAKED